LKVFLQRKGGKKQAARKEFIAERRSPAFEPDFELDVRESGASANTERAASRH